MPDDLHHAATLLKNGVRAADTYFDVTGESVPAWAVGVDPDERGPPTDWEFVDPPAPET